MAARRMDAQRMGLTPAEFDSIIAEASGRPLGAPLAPGETRGDADLPPIRVLVAMAAQRAALPVVAYVHSRTEAELTADVEAWVATWATPARILMGAFTGGRTDAPQRNNHELRGPVSDAEARGRADGRPVASTAPTPPGMAATDRIPDHAMRHANKGARMYSMDSLDTPERIDRLNTAVLMGQKPGYPKELARLAALRAGARKVNHVE